MKTILRAIVTIGLTASLPLGSAVALKVQVFKTATCGCCAKWVEHLRANGFEVSVQDVPSTAPYREKYGVPEKLASCHTAVAGGYAIEGHVPAADIQRLITSGQKAKGLAVPGMPAGSPGMEGPTASAYSTMLFEQDGKVSVYQSHPAH